MTQHELEEKSYSGNLQLGTWKGVMPMIRPYFKWFPLILGFSLALSVIEAIFPMLMSVMINNAASGEGPVKIWIASYGLAALGLVFGIFFLIYFAGKVATGVGHDVRRANFARLQQLEFAYYDRRSVGWLVSRITSDTERMSNMIVWFTVDLVWGSTMILFACGMMLWLNWQVGLAVMIIVPFLLIVSRYFKVKLLGFARDMSKLNSEIIASHTENITGVRTTKTLAREQENLAEFEIKNQNQFRVSSGHGITAAAYGPMVMALCTGGAAIALWMGGQKTLLPQQVGAMSLGELIAFMMYAMMLAQPVQQIAHQFAEMLRAQAAVERIVDLLDQVPEIKDSEAVLAKINAHVDQKSDGSAEDGLPDSVESVEFRNIEFSYDESKKVLKNFNLKVSPGETVALVGPTGGGKSTIVNLLARFYEPTQGELLVDGSDYRERSLAWYQSKFGIVLQTPHLFSGSIADNIRYGRKEASLEEVIESAKLVRAHHFIEELENGYETEVGEGGVRLSGGQKQLISFARAIITNPRIFIMDEATSSIDSETEKLIQSGVEEVMKGRISFVIAHRLSTIRHADRILFIERGEIAEQGSHHELMQQQGKYFALYTGQFQRETSLHGEVA